MAKLLTYNATIVGREDCTKELTIFRVRHDEPIEASPVFVPGQYVALGMNNEEDESKGAVRRSMSLAGAPEENVEGFDFYIRYVNKPESDNPLTHLMWKAKVGDRMFMTRKPVGKFTIPDTVGASDTRLKIMVAAGTGLAPFVSMVRSEVMRDANADLSKCVLLHGASYPDDLVYRDELSKYRDENGLKYFTTVSRPKEAPDWTGDTGRVEDYFKPERIEALEQAIGVERITPKNAGILICGLQGTIAQTIIRTVGRGFIPDHRRIRKALEVPDDASASIWWEQYDKTPVIDVNDASVVDPLKAELKAALA